MTQIKHKHAVALYKEIKTASPSADSLAIVVRMIKEHGVPRDLAVDASFQVETGRNAMRRERNHRIARVGWMLIKESWRAEDDAISKS